MTENNVDNSSVNELQKKLEYNQEIFSVLVPDSNALHITKVSVVTQAVNPCNIGHV